MNSEVNRFRSKYDAWIIAVLLIPLIFLIYTAVAKFSLVLIVALIPSALLMWFVGDCFVNTYYEVSGTTLRIKCGFLIDEKIDIMQIKSILPTHTILSSPAWSMDRIMVKYGKYNSIAISPADKEEFIKMCLAVNPDIETSRVEK